MEDHNKYENNELLIEQKNVRQHEGEPFRRVFFSKMVQIDMWYRDGTCNSIWGTQITLDENNVITATEGKPISYTISEENTILNQSAILRANGYADKNLINTILVPLLQQLQKQESEYVYALLKEINKDNYVQYPII